MSNPDIGATCVSHLQFMQWADEIMLGALLAAPDDKVSVDLGSSFKTLLDTLNHVYLAELVWLRRVQGNPTQRMADLPVPADSKALEQAWPDMHRAWLDWAGGRGADGWLEPCVYRSMKGEDLRMPYWQIVLHLVNHGSYHRGQFATMLRQSGIAPPPTDLLMYYRTH